jgi:hypothetical protein
MSSPSLQNAIETNLARLTDLRNERETAKRALAALEEQVAHIEGDLKVSGGFYVGAESIDPGERERIRALLAERGIVL